MSLFGIDFPGDGDDVATLDTTPDYCQPCYEAHGIMVEFEYEQRYNHSLAGYVDVYECPECGREILASDEITTAEGERF